MRLAAKTWFVRIVSGVFGVIAAMLAVFGGFFFIANSAMELESSKQYNGHVSILPAIGGSLLVVGIDGFFEIGAYKLLRRAAGRT